MDLIENPPSLRLLSVGRIRESISCMGQNVEKDLIEKLTAGDLHELRNPNVPVSQGDMCKYSSVFNKLLFFFCTRILLLFSCIFSFMFIHHFFSTITLP